jgi:hypothetical protein
MEAATRELRVSQFRHYLRLLEHRTTEIESDDCFMIFTVPMPEEAGYRLSATERIIQFAATEKGYYVDLPDTTVTPEEASKIVAERPGFAYALDRVEKTLGERQFDPVQRCYTYDQEKEAAEDAVYILYDIWRTPLEQWISVTGSSFDTDASWEQGFSMA